MTNADLPDVNVLLALLQPAHAAHDLAWAWFETAERFATTPVTELGLIRLSLNPKIMGQPISSSAALASLRSLQAHPRAIFLADDSSLATAAIDLTAMLGHRQVTDLHLVGLAARHGLQLVTLDRSLHRSLSSADRKHVHLIG